ncbi:MAG TPA: nitrate/sulfonate/bicarbonate ABC transporter ATP-binding protein [Stellaceae bacterium]|nr:nitrate/sulfonate/bicarbonate ABC transporter ATP-binding protein [Stellaceae bacterium]
MAETAPPISELRGVSMAFAKPSGAPLPVLAKIDMALRDGEILGLLGRSGSGKSTLLRITGGLIKPSSGQVLYRGAPLEGPAEGIAVVFQTFALYPWLTVLQNVEFGLDALGLSLDEARRRATSAIDLIGLDGFQSAYPRELSGGMRQRVGFARALVSEPILLLMDEPFSALDVLTAETLRTDFLDLWVGHRLPTKAALMVTHNIEEAVLMCDRILVLGSNPGHIAAEIAVPLAHPRNRLDAAFHAIVDQIYSILTSRMAEAIGAQSRMHGGMAQPLPEVSTNRMGGFVEALASPPYGGQAELAKIAAPLALEINDLFPIAAALHMLEFAELKESTIRLTAAGRVFAESGTEERKRLFREHLLRFVPLAAHIRQVLEEREGHHAPRVRFESELEDHLTRRDAEKTLRAVTGWARYAEIFEYDDRARVFRLGAP